MRALLVDLLGEDAVAELTDRAVARILGAVFMTARRELERHRQIPGQLGLDD